MHKWEKYNDYNPKNPTFSSNLLDKINKSIKTNTKNDLEDDLSFFRAKKEAQKSKEDKITILRRANLVEQWMENKKVVKQSKVKSKLSNNNTLLEEFDVQDTLFFSTTSSTSSSSSEPEFSYSGYSHPSHQQSKQKPKRQVTRGTCFAPPPPHVPLVPKPIRTRPEQHVQVESKFLQQQQQQKQKQPEELFKFRSRAVKMYSNLKNLKQPISPGVRLTSFINSLFTNREKNKNTNRNKKKNENENENEDDVVVKSEKITKTSYSACTTPRSYARSCLSNNNRDKKVHDDHGIKRTVRFCPINVIVNEDSTNMQRKHQSTIKQTSQISTCTSKFARSLSKTYEGIKGLEKNDKELEEVALGLLNGYCWGKKGVNSKSSGERGLKVNDCDYGSNYRANCGGGVDNCDYDDNDNDNDIDNDNDNDDDGLSCSSSDLFELDHLSLIGNELPVYETTRFDPKLH